MSAARPNLHVISGGGGETAQPADMFAVTITGLYDLPAVYRTAAAADDARRLQIEASAYGYGAPKIVQLTGQHRFVVGVWDQQPGLFRSCTIVSVHTDYRTARTRCAWARRNEQPDPCVMLTTETSCATDVADQTIR